MSIEGKKAALTIANEEELLSMLHALSNPVRLSIIRELGDRSLNVGDLAEKLSIPMSTAALAVKTLEEAGIIAVDYVPGVRGAMKLCSRRLDNITVTLDENREPDGDMTVMRMPVGAILPPRASIPPAVWQARAVLSVRWICRKISTTPTV